MQTQRNNLKFKTMHMMSREWGSQASVGAGQHTGRSDKIGEKED